MVRTFVHLLDLGDSDIREEAELLRLREEVVRSIRFNRQLESDLDLMDLKIGLLVRNRATLQVWTPNTETHTHTDANRRVHTHHSLHLPMMCSEIRNQQKTVSSMILKNKIQIKHAEF